MAPDIIYVPEMSDDKRLRVFRRNLTIEGEFDNMEVDAYVLLSERYVIVFDTLVCPEDMTILTNSIVNEIVGREVLVVNSHADWDHPWGNNYFTGERRATIIGHQICRERLQSEEARKKLAAYQQFPVFRNVVLTPPTVTFSNSLTINGGDLTVELFPAPGHAPDHIAAWIPELSTVLAFDAVEKPMPILESAATLPTMRATLKRLLELPAERVLCSHGKTTSMEMVKENLAYFDEVERRSREQLAQHPGKQFSNAELEQGAELIGYPLDEVVARVNAVTGPLEPMDRQFYTWVHNHNIKCVIASLQTQA